MDNNELDKILKQKLKDQIKPSKELENKIKQKVEEEKLKKLRSMNIENTNQKHKYGKMRTLISTYAESKELIEVGAYESGRNPTTDLAVELHPQIEEFLIQDEMENSSLKETLEKLSRITDIKIPQEEFLSEDELKENETQSANLIEENI